MSHSSQNIFRYLTDDGLVYDGTNQDMAIATPTKFFLGPPAGQTWSIERLLFSMTDVGTGTSATYGAAPALSSGVRLYVTETDENGTELLDLMGGSTVKDNGGFAAHCYDVSIANPGAGGVLIGVRWTLSKSGSALMLRGYRGEKLVCETQDDLSALITHTVVAQGIAI